MKKLIEKLADLFLAFFESDRVEKAMTWSLIIFGVSFILIQVIRYIIQNW